MTSMLSKQITFLSLCIVMGTVLACIFFHYQPGVEDYFENKHFKNETQQMISVIKKYSKAHANYDSLTPKAFADEELPNGIYRNVNDVDLESIKGGQLHISGSSSSRYNDNKNAFVIGWMDVDGYGCRALVKENWTDLPNARFLGLTIAESDDELMEDEIYINCPGRMNMGSAVACPNGTNLATPIEEEDIKEVCACTGGHCRVLLKFI